MNTVCWDEKKLLINKIFFHHESLQRAIKLSCIHIGPDDRRSYKNVINRIMNANTGNILENIIREIREMNEH